MTQPLATTQLSANANAMLARLSALHGITPESLIESLLDKADAVTFLVLAKARISRMPYTDANLTLGQIKKKSVRTALQKAVQMAT